MSLSDFNLANGGEETTISKYRIAEAEKDGVLDHCASTYNSENDILEPGIQTKGPRVIDFANILKYEHVPFSDALNLTLDLFKQAMGSPVEIEYAIDLEEGEYGLPTFYLLQIKPLIRHDDDVKIDIGEVNNENLLLLSQRGMGNGIIEGIKDVVYVDVNHFDKTKTREIASEIHKVNLMLAKEQRQYVLIGPGRWGTRDVFTGIPVLWSNINCAKVIVEMGLPDFPLDASLGSHFFHNVTSMNVGYFSIPYRGNDNYLDLDVLEKQELVWEGEFVKVARFKNDLEILMDGRKRTALIQYSL
jgi:hypothetical protein